MKTNVSHVVSDGLCMSCGICQDTCAKKCIRIHHGKDVNYPEVDMENAMNVDYV